MTFTRTDFVLGTDYTFDAAVLELLALEAELAGRADLHPLRRIWGCGGASNRCAGLCNQ